MASRNNNAASSPWLLLVALLGAAALAATPASAAMLTTGENVICCAYILKPASENDWQLVCNDPSKTPGAESFPSGTIVTNIQFVPGKVALCEGSFPYPDPSPYALPRHDVQLTTPPNGVMCAGQFGNFFQSLQANGTFMVKCSS